MNDMYLPLTAEENSLIYANIKERCKEESNLWACEKPLLFFSEHEVSVSFKCFLKSFGSSIVILLVPSTMQDVKTFLKEDAQTGNGR